METIIIPKDEYLELLDLYQRITKKLQRINQFDISEQSKNKINAMKYCGVISLSNDALKIQKQMRDEWE